MAEWAEVKRLIQEIAADMKKNHNELIAAMQKHEAENKKRDDENKTEMRELIADMRKRDAEFKAELQKRDAENKTEMQQRDAESNYQFINDIQKEFAKINKSLTEQLELYKKQWGEVTPEANVQYTYDTHKPSVEPDTAPQLSLIHI